MLIPNVLCCLILWDTSYKCLLWQKPILWHIFPYIYGTILDRKYSKSSKNMHNAFLEIYHTIFYRALIEGVLSKDLVYNWLYTKYKNIEFLTLFEYHCTWELTVVWRLISCHLHQNPGKEYIYDIPYCAIHLILFENWKRFLSSFFINGRSIQRCCIVRKFEICDIFEMRNLKWFKLRFISTYL